jgi:hypothetical protein
MVMVLTLRRDAGFGSVCLEDLLPKEQKSQQTPRTELNYANLYS